MELRVLAIFLTLTGAQQVQLDGPENTLSVVGSNVTLKCVSPSRNCHQILWTKSIPPYSSSMYVFRDPLGISGGLSDRYSVDNSSGCNLIIKNVNLTDAGRFICLTPISSKYAEAAASLTILKDEPKCTTSPSENNAMEGDRVQMTCLVTYNPITKASMVWEEVENVQTVVDNRTTISRSFSVVASASVVPSFTCATSFAVDTRARGIATNIPVITCITPSINILYSVRDVTLSPSSSYYTAGTIITCEAKGNPSPILKWQATGRTGNWVNIQNQNNAEFTRNDVSSQWYRCYAENVVKGKRYSATSEEFQFDQASTDELTSTTRISDPEDGDVVAKGGLIGIGFGIGLLASIVLMTVAFAILIRLGYLKFCPNQENKFQDDVAKHSGHKINPSSHQLTVKDPPPQRAGAPFTVEQASTYTGLGEHRDVSVYESIE